MQARSRGALARVERPATLVDGVVRAIRAEIAAGRYARGSRLPSEETLANDLGVSRTVVREAVAQLRADGVVFSRKGSGVYVSETPQGNALRIPAVGTGSHELRYVFELRFWAEVAAAELAAMRRTPADLRRLEETLGVMAEQARDLPAAAAADVAFHGAIAAATRNPYFVTLVDLLTRPLVATRHAAWVNAARVGVGSQPAHREHAAIYRAVRDSRPQAAREAAMAHLIAAAERMRIDVRSMPALPRRKARP